MSRKAKLSRRFKDYNFLGYYKKNRSKKNIYRCLGCHYIKEGKSFDEVAKLLKFNRNSIIEWVSRFEEGGISLLLSIRKGRGIKAKLSSVPIEDFANKVVKLQEDRNGGRVIGDDIVQMVKDEYGVSYSRSGIYKVLSRFGLSWVSARSIHPKSNTKDQEEFKKTLQKG
jgi:transposase